MTDSPSTTAPAQRSRSGYLASAVAVVVSLASLGLAISGNHTQERMLAASVWPHVEYGSSNLDEAGAAEIRLLLVNQGVGPARLRTLEIRHEGQPVTAPDELLARCCEAGEGTVNWISASTRARVLAAGTTLEFLRVPAASNRPEVWKAFDRERHRLHVTGCYCSVLDECWRAGRGLPGRGTGAALGGLSPARATRPGPAPAGSW
jgi:hypothetical protein